MVGAKPLDDRDENYRALQMRSQMRLNRPWRRHARATRVVKMITATADN